ncbi:MAG: hypothetical protein Q6370_011580 [Candidatus Sigynarchaeota archaeon]
MTENIDLMIEIALYLISLGYKVFVNRRNAWGIPVFHVTGSAGSKPDVIAINKKYERLAYTSSLLDGIPTTLPTVFAIELKAGDHLHEITSGVSQLNKYWSRWVSGQVQYYTDGGGVIKHINWFLLATKHSFAGYLYKEEIRNKPISWDFFTPTFHQLDFVPSKIIESFIFAGKHERLDDLRAMAARRGFVPGAVPEVGVLKRGISMDGRLTDDMVVILPSNVVRLGPRPPGEAAS